MRVEVRTKGVEPRSGSFRTSFIADGFGTPPECDPPAPPVFAAKAATKPPASSEELAKPGATEKESEAIVFPKQRDAVKPAKGVRGAPKVIDWKLFPTSSRRSG